MPRFLRRTLITCLTFFLASHSYADLPARADSHAPIGVMADHMHAKGGWMFSYRYMRMEMEGNRSGTDDLSADAIVMTASNRFAPPANLRVVPTKMVTDMHMLGMMYAPSDTVTLMAMLPYMDKRMQHTTYAGMMGTNVLGGFTTESSGIGDLKVSGLINLHHAQDRQIHAQLGVSLPTGATDASDRVLTPMNTTPELRLPYPMQLGSGTYDVLAGLTYNGRSDGYSWGAQYSAVLRTGSDSGYTLGDQHNASAWAAKLLQPATSVSLRISFTDQGNIDGSDPLVRVPVQTADPDRQGRQRVDIAVGVNYLVLQGGLAGNRFSLELNRPVYQDLDGPQLESDLMLTAGYQIAW